MKRLSAALMGLPWGITNSSSRAASLIRSAFGRTSDRSTPDRLYDGAASLPSDFSESISSYRWSTAPITVLVPVHNAMHEVDHCLDALLAHTPPSADIIILDDASTEPGLAARLAAAAEAPNVTLVHSSENMGFTRTINRGIALAGDRDVVFLNSDTEVAPRWLTYLRSAAYERDDIGTATALSNSASQFSVPFRFHNSYPYWMDLAAYARSIAQLDGKTAVRIPFGHGFCLYVKRRYIDTIGLLDSDAFPRGYGEEVDFCLRGARAGWTHVLATKCFVYHANAASFGGSKQVLKEQARAVLDRQYPEYTSLLGLNSRNPSIQELRRRVARIWHRIGAVPARKLLVLGSESLPGEEQAVMLPEELADLHTRQESVLVLSAHGRSLRISQCQDGRLVPIAEGRVAVAPDPFTPYGEGYDDLVARWLIRFAVESIEIRGLRGHGAGLGALAQHLDLPLVLTLVDDFPICPTGSLRDELGQPCRGRCTPTQGDCLATSDPHGRRLKHQYIRAWQQAQRHTIEHAGRLLVDSHARRQTLIDLFPKRGSQEIRIVDACTSGRPGDPGTVAAALQARARLRVGLLALRPPIGIDRGLHMRVLAPLSQERFGEWLRVERIEPGAASDDPVDIAIIPFESSMSTVDAKRLVKYAAGQRIPLIVDTGDHSIQAAAIARRPSGLGILLRAATEVWAETVPATLPAWLAATIVRIPTCLDERIWPLGIRATAAGPDATVRVLFIADQADDAGVIFAINALDAATERIRSSIELVVVTLGRRLPKRPWLRHLRVPDAALSYPLFVTWLSRYGPFDIGIAPPTAPSSGRTTMLLEYAALGATALVSARAGGLQTVAEREGMTSLPASVPQWGQALQQESANVMARRAANDRVVLDDPDARNVDATANAIGDRLGRYCIVDAT
ncbi:MAG: glycosyltransferase family 2 protein [Thiohalocapsa sp.]